MTDTARIGENRTGEKLTGEKRTDHSRTAIRTGWTLSPALAGAVVVGIVAIAAAFVMTRVEPALVGAPLLLSAALSWDRRPRRESEAAGDAHGPDGAADDILVETSVASEGAAHPAPDGSASLSVAIHAAGTQRPDALQLRLALGGAAPVDAVLTPAAAARVSAEVPVVHSGRQRVASITARAIGADAAWVGRAGEEAAVERVVRPRRVPLRSLPLPARLLGLTGQHTSTRPGDGGEFRDIDVFHPGDRLRRIDWRATARAGRAGELYVRRTTATSDAAVHLVVDARDDLTGIVADWSRAYQRPAVSSLDLAREAASSLAFAYSGVGDRVGFDDLGESRRVLPPRAGARHRERVLREIELTTATGTTFQRVRSPRLSPGSIVYVLSTFLDDQPSTLALTWRTAGHRVVAVDVLPARDGRDLTTRERLALRTIEVERRLRLQQLQGGGVELLTWQDPVAREAGVRTLAAGRSRR
ncbi:DUF58 domain-containing protein [Leifsonia sp. LS-T14]|uniref:DUF58 domain-containing protein n=1 Tax=unclassified Leifsonia TaxID=2663824 RepID=UPI0035A6F294